MDGYLVVKLSKICIYSTTTCSPPPPPVFFIKLAYFSKLSKGSKQQVKSNRCVKIVKIYRDNQKGLSETRETN